MLLIVALLFTVACAGTALFIAISGLTDDARKSDVIVVLGNKVQAGGEPSLRLKARLDRALALFRQGYAPAIVVSGGIDAQAVDEAAAMQRYLERAGVPGDRVYADHEGVDTYNTARNTAVLMREQPLLLSAVAGARRCCCTLRLRYGGRP